MIFVDSLMACLPNKNWKYNQSCHMFVDTCTNLEELHAFAIKIGLKRSWFQDGKVPHYDLIESRRVLAIMRGAVPIDRKHAVAIFKRWKAEVYK